MTSATPKQFTNSHTVFDDGKVTFKCSSDRSQWPWLALPPLHPIAVQTINYWASVETGAARGTFDPKKWSALTQTEWRCGKPSVGHATHGIADTIDAEGAPRYGLTFFDAGGSLVYHMSGTGVVFETSDFETRRKKAKQQTLPSPGKETFQYAAASSVGVASQKESFLSDLNVDALRTATALISKENGFTPRHPYHSGSGDHVNSNHLADAAQQFLSLLKGGAPFYISGGEMTFKRYVELGVSFDLALADGEQARDKVSISVHQAGKLCTTVTLKYSDK